jgi:hypothetical protein
MDIRSVQQPRAGPMVPWLSKGVPRARCDTGNDADLIRQNQVVGELDVGTWDKPGHLGITGFPWSRPRIRDQCTGDGRTVRIRFEPFGFALVDFDCEARGTTRVLPGKRVRKATSATGISPPIAKGGSWCSPMGTGPPLTNERDIVQPAQRPQENIVGPDVYKWLRQRRGHAYSKYG